MPQSFVSLHVHIVFATKNRTPLIRADFQPCLYEYIGGILRAHGCSLIAAGGMPDHVHLLVSLSRELSVAEITRLVKANASKWVHETFPDKGDFGWQAGYGAFTVSFSAIEVLQRYIADQAQQHRKMTFKEELLALLRRHHVEFDERFLGD